MLFRSIFRRIKFINIHQMSLKAMQLVMEHKKVPTRNRDNFFCSMTVHLRVRFRTQHIYRRKLLRRTRSILILSVIFLSILCFYRDYCYDLIFLVAELTDIFFVYLVICAMISESHIYFYEYHVYFYGYMNCFICQDQSEIMTYICISFRHVLRNGES